MAHEVADSLEGILESKTMADFKIVCGGETFDCHRLILSARSPYFRAMFDSNMVESETGRMEIMDMEVETVRAMIKFIYSGKVDPFRPQPPKVEVTGVLGPQAIELLVASDRYDLSGLKKLCESSLVDGLTIDNVLDLLILADTHNAEELKKAAKNLVVEKGADIVEKTEWKEKLVKFPNLFCEVFEAVVKESRECVCLRDRGRTLRNSTSYQLMTWRGRSESPTESRNPYRRR